MRAFRVVLAAASEEAATAALWEAGTVGVEVRPAGERLEMLSYFSDEAELTTLQAALPGALVEPTAVPEVDWVRHFREGFRPFQAGRFLIAPAWEAKRPAPDVLRVDPARAFGTGTHETTRLCLAAIEDLASRRPLGRTLDLGAGTGLLAIAAWRLGAGPVVASDIDPEATASSTHHAALNAAPLRVVRADGGRGLRAGGFDLVLANLMALLLVDRAAEIRALLAPGAALVLSGLLLEDVAAVAAAFAGCGTPRQQTLGEWAALVYEGAR